MFSFHIRVGDFALSAISLKAYLTEEVPFFPFVEFVNLFF